MNSKEEKLKIDVLEALNNEADSLALIFDIIIKYKDSGGQRIKAFEILESLYFQYIEDENKNDILCDVMDDVGGFRPWEYSIWNNPNDY